MPITISYHSSEPNQRRVWELLDPLQGCQADPAADILNFSLPSPAQPFPRIGSSLAPLCRPPRAKRRLVVNAADHNLIPAELVRVLHMFDDFHAGRHFGLLLLAQSEPHRLGGRREIAACGVSSRTFALVTILLAADRWRCPRKSPRPRAESAHRPDHSASTHAPTRPAAHRPRR